MSDKSKSVVSGEELEEDENFVPTNNKKIKVGDRVKRKGDEDEGIVKFLGLTKFAKGTWVGIELEKPNGKNNGTVQGISYFKCKEKHGIFVKLQNVVLISSAPEEALENKEDIQAKSNSDIEKFFSNSGPQQKPPVPSSPPPYLQQETETPPQVQAQFQPQIQLQTQPIETIHPEQKEEAKIIPLNIQESEKSQISTLDKVGNNLSESKQENPSNEENFLPQLPPLKKDSSGTEQETSESIEELKITEKPKTKAPFTRKIAERNENLRRLMAVQLVQAFNKTLSTVDQIYLGLNDTLALTQDISTSLTEFNDALVKLRTVLPSSSHWVDSFLASEGTIRT